MHRHLTRTRSDYAPSHISLPAVLFTRADLSSSARAAYGWLAVWHSDPKTPPPPMGGADFDDALAELEDLGIVVVEPVVAASPNGPHRLVFTDPAEWGR